MVKKTKENTKELIAFLTRFLVYTGKKEIEQVGYISVFVCDGINVLDRQRDD